MKIKTGLKIAFVFAVIQTIMPLLGYLLGYSFSTAIQGFDHWVAFILLGIIGSNMIREGIVHIKKPKTCEEKTLTLWILITLGIATSIDALAAGLSLAFLNVDLIWALLSIFSWTVLISFFGYLLGKKLGELFKVGAELFGGCVLIGLGLKILIDHLVV